MHRQFQTGALVKVWPRTSLLVQEDPNIPGRFMPPEGKELPWSEWLMCRVSDGSLLLTDPRPVKEGD